MVIEVYVLSTRENGNVGVYQFLDQAYKDAGKVLTTDNVYAKPNVTYEAAAEILGDSEAVIIRHEKPMHGDTVIKIEKFSLYLDEKVFAGE